jgi:hypothetical protein
MFGYLPPAGALTDGAIVLVNGSVSIVDAKGAAAAIQLDSLTLAYNTKHAVREIGSALPAASVSSPTRARFGVAAERRVRRREKDVASPPRP